MLSCGRLAWGVPCIHIRAALPRQPVSITDELPPGAGIAYGGGTAGVPRTERPH